MTQSPQHTPALLEPVDLEAAAAALCCRFGEASAEAYRLSTLRDVLGSSRALSQALDEFTKLASVHYRGVHSTANMHANVEQLSRALMEWSESVFAAGAAYREWQAGVGPRTHDAPPQMPFPDALPNGRFDFPLPDANVARSA